MDDEKATYLDHESVHQINEDGAEMVHHERQGRVEIQENSVEDKGEVRANFPIDFVRDL